MSLFGSIHLANNTLRTTQVGLQVVGQNIANASTPGYAREEALLVTGPTQQYGDLLLGMGVRIEGVVQRVDQALDQRVRSAISDRAGAEVQEQSYLSLERVIGELKETDLSTALTPGPHRITIRVDNRMIIPVGINSHSVTDHTQGNWNGLIGKLELQAGEKLFINDLQIFPDVENKTARLKIGITNLTNQKQLSALTVTAECPMGKPLEPLTANVVLAHGTNQISLTYNLGPKTLTWDARNPWLYTLKVSLPNGESRSVKFGLRKFSAAGSNFAINGQKIFLRGTLECAIFPLTGYPPTDETYWRKIITACKAHGLNHIRFHSWCPPQAAFKVADEMGFYYQVECPSWANGPTRSSRRPTPPKRGSGTGPRCCRTSRPFAACPTSSETAPTGSRTWP